MTGIELKLARELLGLTQDEAATYIGGVNQRSWAYWESGQRAVKQDVADLVNVLLGRRRKVISEFFNIKENDADTKDLVLIYYTSPDDCATHLEWRFGQSLARTLALDFGVKWVEFDKTSYVKFLEESDIDDTPSSRSLWASYQYKKINNTKPA